MSSFSSTACRAGDCSSTTATPPSNVVGRSLGDRSVFMMTSSCSDGPWLLMENVAEPGFRVDGAEIAKSLRTTWGPLRPLVTRLPPTALFPPHAAANSTRPASTGMARNPYNLFMVTSLGYGTPFDGRLVRNWRVWANDSPPAGPSAWGQVAGTRGVPFAGDSFRAGCLVVPTATRCFSRPGWLCLRSYLWTPYCSGSLTWQSRSQLLGTEHWESWGQTAGSPNSSRPGSARSSGGPSARSLWVGACSASLSRTPTLSGFAT